MRQVKLSTLLGVQQIDLIPPNNKITHIQNLAEDCYEL